MVHQVRLIVERQTLPYSRLGIVLDVEALRADDEIIEGHGGDFVAQATRRFVPQGDEPAVVRLPLLKLPYQCDALHEETLGKRGGDHTVGELRVLVSGRLRRRPAPARLS